MLRFLRNLLIGIIVSSIFGFIIYFIQQSQYKEKITISLLSIIVFFIITQGVNFLFLISRKNEHYNSLYKDKAYYSVNLKIDLKKLDPEALEELKRLIKKTYDLDKSGEIVEKELIDESLDIYDVDFEKHIDFEKYEDIEEKEFIEKSSDVYDVDFELLDGDVSEKDKYILKEIFENYKINKINSEINSAIGERIYHYKNIENFNDKGFNSSGCNLIIVVLLILFLVPSILFTWVLNPDDINKSINITTLIFSIVGSTIFYILLKHRFKSIEGVVGYFSGCIAGPITVVQAFL